MESIARAGASRFVVAGISMGGFAALAAPQLGPPVAAVLAFLASPHWDDRPHSPHFHLEPWRHTALFAVVASGDDRVPPEGMRAFSRRLSSHFEATTPYRCLEYPGGHTMSPDDWDDAWSKALLWLDPLLP